MISPVADAGYVGNLVFYCDNGVSVGDPYPIPMGP
jgi:hypothetical protein